MAAYLLSEEDRQLWLEFKQFYRSQLQNLPNRTYAPPADELWTPEVYLARIPAGGIEALAPGDVIPPSAECLIYHLISPSGDPEQAQLSQLGGSFKRVYNPNPVRIPGNNWGTLLRDKGGSWIVVGLYHLTGEFGEGTGTGTGTGDGCDPILITEQEVRCEDGDLNVYSRTRSIEIVNGCLSSSTTDWGLDRNEGRCSDDAVTVVNVTDISNLAFYTTNVIYFNSYDQNFYINVVDIWYILCPCGTDTGTGTGTGTGGGGGVTWDNSCCDDIPTTLYCTFSGGTGDCACLNGLSIPMETSNGNSWQGIEVNPCGGNDMQIALLCQLGTWTFSSSTGCNMGPASPGATSCSPFHLQFTGVTVSGCCTGTIDFDITS